MKIAALCQKKIKKYYQKWIKVFM